jgi:superoxide dismutase, Cu-Zn family
LKILNLMKAGKISMVALLIIVCCYFTGYTQMDQDVVTGLVSSGQEIKAICVLYPTAGNNVSGTITFTSTEKGVKVVVDVQGLTKGKHGIHIHEYGDCSAPDGSSAGGHFNPVGMMHGGPMDITRHMGDMGNLEADGAGKAHLEYFDQMISMKGENSIIGKSVILHKNEDDLKTQPAGNAGPRVACGVIGLAK